MASLAHYPNSPYWIACFRDENRKQCRRSTHETNRRRAQDIADTMEQVAKRKLNARRIREVVNDIYREVSGESLPHASVAGYAAAWLAQKSSSAREALTSCMKKGSISFSPSSGNAPARTCAT